MLCVGGERFFADDLRNRFSALERHAVYRSSDEKEGLEFRFLDVRAVRRRRAAGDGRASRRFADEARQQIRDGRRRLSLPLFKPDVSAQSLRKPLLGIGDVYRSFGQKMDAGESEFVSIRKPLFAPECVGSSQSSMAETRSDGGEKEDRAVRFV